MKGKIMISIFLTIVFQLILIGIINTYYPKPITQSKTRYMIGMWIIFIFPSYITYYYVNMLTALTWADFKIVDEPYQQGIMLRTITLPLIPICLILFSILFVPIKQGIVNICFLYLVGYMFWFLYVSGFFGIIFDIFGFIFTILKLLAPYILIVILIFMYGISSQKKSE